MAPPEFKPGDRIVHPLFGAGAIRMINGSGPDAKLTVDFSSQIGSKKLIAGMANLQRAGEISSTDSTAPAESAYYEIARVTAQRHAAMRCEAAAVHDSVFAAAMKPVFWTRLRERLRGRGSMPKVLDDPSGRVFVQNVVLDARGRLQCEILVQHELLTDARVSTLGREFVEELRRDQDCLLNLFKDFAYRTEVSATAQPEEDGAVQIAEDELGQLPDRSPRFRPKAVLPKGVIRSIPKRRDDY